MTEDMITKVARAIVGVYAGEDHPVSGTDLEAARAAMNAMLSPGIPVYASRDATDEVLGGVDGIEMLPERG